MKVKILDQRHPCYDGKCLAERRALYCGGEEWRELVETWLPRLPDETVDTYNARKARALYTNHAGPIVDLLGAAVFSEPPTVAGLTGAWVADWTANVDREGASLTQFFAARLVDALVDRTTWCWVNLPDRGGAVVDNRAAEEQAGLLNAFLVPLRAEAVIDWEHDDRGGVAWLMVRDQIERRAGVEAPRTRTHRWTYIDRAVVRRWTWQATAERSEPTPDDDATEQSPIAHNLGELPVARLHLPEGLWAMGKLRDPAVAHLRARNDLSWALHRAAHALLVIKSKWEGAKPILGPGTYLQLHRDKDGEDTAEYVEPSGTCFDLLAKDTVQLREELYRVVQQMAVGADSNATRTQMSGESKSQDWRALEIVLGGLAEHVRPFLVDVLRLVAKARGQADAKPVVGGLDGWDEQDLTLWLQAAALATDAHALSPTFRKEVAKRQAARVLEGDDSEALDVVRKEIDAAQVDDPAPYVPPNRTPPAGPGADPSNPSNPEGS